ncbi:MAG: DUF3341 domain-containing protein [Desulfobacterales bacterium]|nr:DUF3341 domain-containing protein [Desulfobacterales bacterium]
MARKHVLGLFADQSRALAAINALETLPYRIETVYSPVPSEKILAALQQGKSRVGYFTLAGAIFGFFAGYGLALFTAAQWNLIVGGKPVFAWAPFLIVAFECTILFAVLGNFMGFLIKTGLPRFRNTLPYDPRCSGYHFGILAACDESRHKDLVDFFRENEGEVSEI